MALSSLSIVLVAGRYLTLNPDVYFPQQRAVYLANTAAIVAHVVGGMLALLLGPAQFVPSIRRRWPRIHRRLGRGYLLGIGLGGVAGLFMARLAYGGPVAQAGFAALAVAWLTTSGLALARIRAGDVAAHRAWMVRSFALTFAAVTLRLDLPLLTALGMDFEVAYATVAWACWLPNLLVAELVVARTRTRPEPRPHVGRPPPLV
jgi:uncharacterized membrane protein